MFLINTVLFVKKLRTGRDRRMYVITFLNIIEPGVKVRTFKTGPIFKITPFLPKKVLS